jgi:hypothetical protein
VDGGGYRIRPSAPAQDRQWQENPVSEIKGQTKNAAEDGGATQETEAQKEVRTAKSQWPKANG